MEDVAEGAGKEAHGRLELVVVIGELLNAVCQSDGGEAEQVLIVILTI